MDINGEIAHILDKVILGNTLADYFLALSVFAVSLILFKIFREIVLARLKSLAQKTDTDIDDMFIEIFRSLRPPFYFLLSLYVSILFVDLHPHIFTGVKYALILWVGYQITIAFSILVNRVVEKKVAVEEDVHTQSAFRLLGNIAKGAIWIVVAMFVLSNMGVNVNSIIGALGIGGLAIALAVQNILNDLFSSFSIYFDKPFQVGDFIMVGDDMGVVDYIGIKTTRLKALQGEEIVLSNQELTSARVHNYKKLKERRIVFHFGVTYDTSNDSLIKVSKIVEGIVKEEELARFDRAHFNRFDDSALNFEVVYYLLSSEYLDFMDTQQNINLKIKDALEKEGVQFAFPTRTVHVLSN